MKRKHIFSVATIGFLSLLLVAGAAVAAVFPEDNTFTGTVNQFEKGIKIGKQGTGGVTFFNGTIVNATTNDGQDNPVTFGDNVRIDGRIQRGTNNGDDAWNVIVDDGLEVNKNLMVSGESTMKGKVTFEGGVEGIYNVDAYSKTETDSRYEAKKGADKLIVPGTDMQPLDNTLTYNKTNNGAVIPSGSCSWTVPVRIPIGSTVTDVTLYAVDDDGAQNVGVAMFSLPLTTGTPPGMSTMIGNVTSSGTGDTPNMRSFSFPVSGSNAVIKDDLIYNLNVIANSAGNQAIYAVVIDYVHP